MQHNNRTPNASPKQTANGQNETTTQTSGDRATQDTTKKDKHGKLEDTSEEKQPLDPLKRPNGQETGQTRVSHETTNTDKNKHLKKSRAAHQESTETGS